MAGITGEGGDYYRRRGLLEKAGITREDKI